MRWSIRKNAADRPTIHALTQERAATIGEIDAIAAEREEIESEMPHLREFEPSRAANADDRLVELSANEANRRRRLAYIDEGIAKLEAEAAEKAKADERAALEKEARASEALVREIARDAEKLAGKIAKLEEHRARAQAAGVEDAEQRVRRGPRQTLPAITETVVAWFSPEGKRFGSDMMLDHEGRWVRATDRVQREVVDTIREEMTLAGDMPERFVNAIKLVDLEGRKL